MITDKQIEGAYRDYCGLDSDTECVPSYLADFTRAVRAMLEKEIRQATSPVAWTSSDRLEGLRRNTAAVNTMWGEALTHDGDDNVPLYTASLTVTALIAQVDAAYAALDAVTQWAAREGAAGERLLALLLKHGVHPREATP